MSLLRAQKNYRLTLTADFITLINQISSEQLAARPVPVISDFLSEGDCVGRCYGIFISLRRNSIRILCRKLFTLIKVERSRRNFELFTNQRWDVSLLTNSELEILFLFPSAKPKKLSRTFLYLFKECERLLRKR